MDRVGKKCVLYSRVSTEMQVDGFSLAGQKTCLTKFVEREEMKVVGEYEDAGKSGKSIEGRPAFKRMLEDIKNGLQVDYVIVYKLSRFGRNAADVLNSLELIQDYGVNLICTDEGIDSSQASGRLLISVLSAVAQIERENILEQTMNGRREKARQGLWNGGQAPFGYKLVDGKLVIDEEEAEIVKLIFDKYANTTMSMAEVAKYCNDQGIEKKRRGNRIDDYWGSSSIGKIISNSTYIGNIEWGHRQNMKVKGSRELKRVYTNDNIIVSKGQHEPLIAEDLFNKCQVKRKAVQEKLRTFVPRDGVHILTGILTCPYCGGRMTSAMTKRILGDGSVVKTDYYTCYEATRHKKHCNHVKLYDALTCEQLVKNALAAIINDENFINDLEKEFISDNQEALIQKELNNYQKKLKDKNTLRFKLETEIDNMDTEVSGYEKRREALNIRLNKIYDEIFEIEDKIEENKKKLRSYSDDLISADYIKSLLRNFSSFYDEIPPKEKKELLNALIKKIYINERDDVNFLYSLKGIEFNFPVFKNSKLLKEVSTEDLELIPVKEAVNMVVQNVEFGDDDGQIHLDPIRKEIRIYGANGNLNEKGLVISNYIKTDKSNQLITAYVKEHFNLVVYAPLIRTVKYEIGIKYKGSDRGICTFLNTHISLERFDAIAQAIKDLDFVPDALKTDYDSRVLDARERLVNTLDAYVSKPKLYEKIIREVKHEKGLIITYGNIRNIIKMVSSELPPKRYKYLPSLEKAKIIANKLVKYEILDSNGLELKIEETYKEQESSIIKRKRYTNDDIISFVKDKYNLVVCASMICCVREEYGIIVKAKDRRYDPTHKNRRNPSTEQHDAIVDAMTSFGMIA